MTCKIGSILNDFIIFDSKATGRIVAGGGELKADFALYQLCNGNVIIEATTDSSIEVLMGGRNTRTIDSLRGMDFAIDGRSEDGYSFRIEHAIYRNFSTTSQGGITWIFAIRAPEHLILHRGQVALSRSQIHLFTLTNVLEALNFSMTAGGYKISFCKDIQGNQIKMMRYMRLPAVTGYLTVELESGDETSLESAEKLANDMRYMLSLAEGNLVSIPRISVLDSRGDVAEIHLRKARMGWPLTGFALIDFRDTSSFVSCALPEFRSMSNKNKQKLRIVIEYYLAAKVSAIIEEILLNGFVALEMLASPPGSSRDPDLDSIGRAVKKRLIGEICQCIDDPCMREQLSSEAVKTLNKRVHNMFDPSLSFSVRVENILAQYGVVFEDLFTCIGEVRKLRNNIVHNGRANGDSILNPRNLLTLLDRLLLAILQYRGYFNDQSNNGLQRRLLTDVIRDRDTPSG